MRRSAAFCLDMMGFVLAAAIVNFLNAGIDSDSLLVPRVSYAAAVDFHREDDIGLPLHHVDLIFDS